MITETRNDGLRALLGVALRAAGAAAAAGMRLRIARYRARQAALRRAYGIEPATPIRGFDAETRRAIEAFAARHPGARFATTSGSTGEPKRVAYTPARLRAIKRENVSAAARMMRALGGARPVMFILSSLKEEGSLASLLTAGRAEPGLLEGLLVPTRYLAHPAVEPLIDRYGAAAVRLWLLALADPGLLYATNPSTIAVFLREVEERWLEATRLVRDVSSEPGLGPEVAAVARRVAGRGAVERLRAIAAAPEPLPWSALAPGLRAYCTWDGGYVRPAGRKRRISSRTCPCTPCRPRRS
ncbi:MAG TPA: hypothetical protein VHF22_07090 [Planctomycetota bacterium]|nr:hypothetical protein [Planctomycetota bacterium]